MSDAAAASGGEGVRASVIMGCKDQAHYLSQAMSSVLDDAPADIELIAIDDGSTDETMAVLERFAAADPRVIVLQHERSEGLAACLNECARRARGEYLIRMDADDVSLPGRIEAQLDFLDAHPEVGVVGGWIEFMDVEGAYMRTRVYPASDEELRRIMLRVSPFAHPATALRKSCFDAVGGYDETMIAAHDLDLWFKLSRVTRFANLQRPVLRYRVHHYSMTANLLFRTQRNSIWFRLRAILRHGYRPSALDLLFIAGEIVTLLLPLPVRWKFALFEWVRDHFAVRDTGER